MSILYRTPCVGEIRTAGRSQTKCSFCNSEGHNAKGCEMKKSFGKPITEDQDIRSVRI